MYDRNEMTAQTLSAVRESISAMELPPGPGAERIIARGQARRYRRWSGVAVAAVVAVVAAVAITVPGGTHPGNATTLKTGAKQVHVELAGYSINSTTNGTVTIYVTDEQFMNPTYMQQVLAQAGVPAVIRVGSFCSTSTQPPGDEQVVSDRQGPHGNVLVITPSAMPQGAELSIGYFPDHVASTMIAAGQSLACVTSDKLSNPNLRRHRHSQSQAAFGT